MPIGKNSEHHHLGGRAHRAWLLIVCILASVPVQASAADGISARPLAPPSGPRGATLFTSVAAADSGVVTENNYDDPEMWGRRAREFDLGGIGTGVAIGDYDGDGRPDLFIVSKTESCRLFRNLGGWKFEDVTDRAGVGDTGTAARVWKQGAAFADVNNDGRLDLYLCRFNAPNLLYLNQGDGTFKESARQYGLDLKDASIMAAFADYDRDGWLDVFVQTNVLDAAANPEGQRDFLLHNNGAPGGTWAGYSDVSAASGVAHGPTHGNSALWVDPDHDGWPDLYVANDFAIPDALYRNNHDGTFTDVIAHAAACVPYSSMGSDFGDINNDGRIDLFIADMAATTHIKDQRTMAEARARLRIPEDGSDEVRQFPFDTLLLDTGVGRFVDVAQIAGLAATDWTWSPRWEDLDNDGRVDLCLTNGMYREIHNQDLIGRRMMAGSPAAAGQVTRNSPALAERHLAFRNLGDLSFEDVSGAWGLDAVGVSFGSALGDLDGDGDLDILYGNYQAGATLLRNDGDAGHRVIVALRGTRSNRFGIGATVTVQTAAGAQVRLLAVARGFMSSSEPVAHFGLGEDTTLARLTVAWPSGVVQEFADLPADRHYTITEPESAPITEAAPPPVSRFIEVGTALGLALNALEESYDEFLDQRLLPMRFNRRGPALAVGAIDASGREALCLGGTTREPLRLVSRPPSGVWSQAIPAAPAPEVDDGPVLLLDTQGNGRADLLITAGGASLPDGDPAYQPRLLLNDGAGHLRPADAGALPELSISAAALCAADFDRDGHLDVFIGGRVSPGLFPAPPRSAVLANRGGRFVDVTETLAPMLRTIGMVTGALWSDLDADGWPDLVLSLDWGTVRYLHNVRGTAFEDLSDAAGFTAAGTGWWRSIAAADFNGDGRPDYAVGNLGLNTGYRAAPDEPALLFAGDFGGRGNTDLIEAYVENGVVYPRRSRSDLGAAIPAIFKRFRANNDFARASLSDIVGADRLAAAQRLAVTEARSGVFLSQPDGRYQFAPWPRLAQIAPANGIAAGDFDGDGRADLYVVHNSHAPAPALGRFDAGLSQLMCGDGLGGFRVVPAAESGLVVPGDAKALVVLDLDDNGWPDFVVSRNNATTLAFHQTGDVARRSVRVDLQGKPGNPRAVGARVTAEYADGTSTAAEICAGSGYYSQSTASLFFGSAPDHRLRRLVVHWPDGAVTTTDDLSGTTDAVLRLSEPMG